MNRQTTRLIVILLLFGGGIAELKAQETFYTWQDMHVNVGLGLQEDIYTEFSLRTPWNSESVNNRLLVRSTYQKELKNYFQYGVSIAYARTTIEKNRVENEYRPSVGVRWSSDPELRFAYRIHVRGELRVFNESNPAFWYGEFRLRARPEFLIAINKPALTQNGGLQGRVDVEFLQNGFGRTPDIEPNSSVRWRAGLTWRQSYQWRFSAFYFVETDLNQGFQVDSHVLRLAVVYGFVGF